MWSIPRQTRIAAHNAKWAHTNNSETASIRSASATLVSLFQVTAAPRWLLVPVMFCVTALSTFTGFYLHSTSLARSARRGIIANSVSGTNLEMRVETREDKLLVSWDARLSFLQTAKYGILSIDDGAAHHDLNLSAADIANGSVLFKPASNDVTFRLEIPSKTGPSITGIVRAPDALVASASVRTEPVQLPRPPLAISSRPARERRGREESVRTLKLKSILPVPVRTQPTQTVQTAGMPDLSIDGVQGSPSLPASSVATRAPDFVAPQSHEPPLSKSTVHEVALSSPVKLAITRSLEYTPPRPLKQVLPTTRAFGSTLVTGPEHVDVEVKIDENGRVREAAIVKNRASAAGPLLNQQALAAARQWVFAPAKMQGKNVPSEHTIHFFFRPETQ